ncbi:12081_t:CDS:1 [Acaulospora morrowiae]|uniref:12081_t:CDS:1 n=1 Tax=Acaulospora morrowiae TaxID=94023 RepID=A0A9N9FWZ5_9GLOM|nr:12081_t:CDS:1 [Acaulospora morrowiae]
MKNSRITRFRRFNFTLYEHVDTSFVKSIEEKFRDLNNCIQYIIFQLEFNHHASGSDERIHMQGFVILKNQMRIGKYDRERGVGSGIKNIFKSNSIHIDFANGTPDQCRDYCSKKYNRCKDHDSCKCDYFDLERVCEKCDENCIRDFARVYDVNRDDTPSGPWEFGVIYNNQNRTEGNSRHSRKNKESEYMTKAIDKIIGGGDIDEAIVECAPMIPSRITVNMDRIAKAVNNINDKFGGRCWDPCNIYIFGTPGTGKTFWTSIVFPNAYKKSMDDDWKWWENYNNNHIVVINEMERGSAS